MLPIAVALLAAFGGVVALGPVYIGLLQRLGFGKRIRVEGPEGHASKAGTPTMGGMLLVVVVMFLAMVMRIEDAATLTPMLTLVGRGDPGRHRRLREREDRDRRARPLQAGLADGRGAARGLVHPAPLRHHRRSTFRSWAPWPSCPVVFILFVAFVIVAMSNGVNLTDGLDGLAGGVLIFSFVAYLLIALVADARRSGSRSRTWPSSAR